MTPQERQLIDDLFGRLAKVESAPRDREASDAIAQGQRQAPNAVYALVQTVLVQDEALKRADARIQELEGGGAPAQQPPGGFLDSMRDALFGGGNANQDRTPSRGSVPPAGGRPAWNTGQVQGNSFGQPQGGQYGQPQGDPRQMGMGNQPGQFGQPQQQGGRGGSFLGTAAATVAGVVGGGLLMNSISGMMGGGGHNKSAFGDTANAGESKGPWNSESSNNDLAKDAGVNDVGSRHSENSNGNDQQHGAYDSASNDDSGGFDDDGFDGDGGDSDYA